MRGILSPKRTGLVPLFKKVADYATENGNWYKEKLLRVLPPDCVDLLIPVKAPETNAGEDIVAWSLTTSGEFSIKTADSICCDIGKSGNRKLFRAIWQLEAPQRLRSFLRLAANNALLTDTNRAGCVSCGGIEDSDGCRKFR